RPARAAGGDAHQAECWVAHSTPLFGKKHKCPQEAVPASKAQEVTQLMLAAVEEALRLPGGAIRPAWTRVQLWGAANPLNVANVPCVWATAARLAACGDWCAQGPPCVETAAHSGLAVADAIHRMFSQVRVLIPVC
ncbi:hypothetical protein CYMTET_31886, partial [Cymbomonas tetramitiformis]